MSFTYFNIVLDPFSSCCNDSIHQRTINDNFSDIASRSESYSQQKWHQYNFLPLSLLFRQTHSLFHSRVFHHSNQIIISTFSVIQQNYRFSASLQMQVQQLDRTEEGRDMKQKPFKINQAVLFQLGHCYRYEIGKIIGFHTNQEEQMNYQIKIFKNSNNKQIYELPFIKIKQITFRELNLIKIQCNENIELIQAVKILSCQLINNRVFIQSNSNNVKYIKFITKLIKNLMLPDQKLLIKNISMAQIRKNIKGSRNENKNSSKQFEGCQKSNKVIEQLQQKNDQIMNQQTSCSASLRSIKNKKNMINRYKKFQDKIEIQKLMDLKTKQNVRIQQIQQQNKLSRYIKLYQFGLQQIDRQQLQAIQYQIVIPFSNSFDNFIKMQALMKKISKNLSQLKQHLYQIQFNTKQLNSLYLSNLQNQIKTDIEVIIQFEDFTYIEEILWQINLIIKINSLKPSTKFESIIKFFQITSINISKNKKYKNKINDLNYQN